MRTGRDRDLVLPRQVAVVRIVVEERRDLVDDRSRIEELVVREAYVDEGPTLKRFRPRAQGRAFRVRKRTSHITVVVAQRPEDAKKTSTRSTSTKRRTR